MKALALDTTVLDLGKDSERMTPKAAKEQHASVDRILGAFYSPLNERREVQMLADEVGLGKTFVALAVAYQTLAALREKNPPPCIADLTNAYRAVLVVIPQGNHALTTKWVDEVGALVKRCGLKPGAMEWFKPVRCETPEDMLIALRKASDLRYKLGSVPTIIVCEAGIFKRKIRESGLKLRFLTAALFRWLGKAIQQDVRWQVIRRSVQVQGYEDWAKRVRRGENVELWDFAAHERYLDLAVDDLRRGGFSERNAFNAVPFRFAEMCAALTKYQNTKDGQDALWCEDLIRGRDEGPCGIVPYCKWVAEKRGNAKLYFDGFKARVSELYRGLFPCLMVRTLPLVIVDEAHHWRKDIGGCRSFVRYLAPFTHRLLLLSATPFQLCWEELDSIFSRADAMDPTIGAQRVEVLRHKRGLVLSAMEKSEKAGRAFSKLWGRLGDDLRTTFAEPTLNGHYTDEAERLTQRVTEYWDELVSATGPLEQHLQAIPGRVRPFFAAALELKQANAKLGDVMRELVIRHRRNTEYRRYRVGHEYPPVEDRELRPDQHQLHAVRGSVLPADAELAQFLLMKVVASATCGRQKTALGTDVTGAYSTLWNSNEGKRAVAAAEKNDAKPDFQLLAKPYFELLGKLTGRNITPNRFDQSHPKVCLALKAALDCWKRDEKTLIFCFRVPTATVLRDLISKEIEKHTTSARRELLLGHRASSDEAAMAQFKSSLTSRTGSVLPAFMDRVLLGFAQWKGWPLLSLSPDEIRRVAELAARARVNGKAAVRDVQKPDRVLLSRICEHVLAERYLSTISAANTEGTDVLTQIADTAWIETRYGLRRRRMSDADPDETADVLTRSSLSASYELTDNVDPAVFRPLFQAFTRSRAANAGGLLDSLVGGPNIFVPLEPFRLRRKGAQQRAQNMTEQLWKITLQTAGMQWEERGEIVDAVNRALLRDHFLLRLPRRVFAGGDEKWSEALIQGFHSEQLFGGKGETVTAKIDDFLHELVQMTANERSHSLQYALNPKGKAVVLVSGSTRERDAVFRGFNSPLFPEILICTQVGQEGIDLHRNCRHVVHYDLGWNPATIEQRTGRVDRIGSKTQRERQSSLSESLTESELPGLEVGVPYLAATYDERMFDRLYTRAQAFDLLTGGDTVIDIAEYELKNDEDLDSPVQFVVLPDIMRQELRVDLSAK